jgi:hypothetical protein
VNLHDEIGRLDATFLPPWQRRRTNATQFGPHVLAVLEREYGVGAIHPRVLPQFPLYFVADGAPPVTGHIDYVAFTGDFERAILVHCVGQHAGHNMRQISFYEEASKPAFTTCSAMWRSVSAKCGTTAASSFCCTYCRR